MPDKIFGLDIGMTSVKAVQIAGGIRGFQVTACAEVGINPEEGLGQAMDVLREQIPVNGATCAISFSSDRISFRNLTLPFTDRKKIEQTLGYELEPLLPFPIDAVTTAYVASDGAENTPVLAACVKNDLLEEHLNILRDRALDPDVIEVGDSALAAQLAKQKNGPSSAYLLDIGAKTSSLTVLLNGTTVLIRSFHFGGDLVTKAIAESQNTSVEQAEALKRQSNGEEFTEIVKPVMASFSRDIRNTLHAFRCQVSHVAAPREILLTGGGALFPVVSILMEDELGLPVELLNLGARMKVDFGAGTAGTWNPMIMNNALALAFREAKSKNSFNLRTGKFKKKRRYDELRGEMKRIAVYLSIILFVFCAQFGTGYYVLKKQKDHLSGEIVSVFKKAFPDVRNIVKPVHQMKIKIREAKESMFLPGDAVVRRAVVDLLRDVSLRIPETADLDVSTIVIDLDKARLKGLTDTFNTVDEIKNGLQDSDLFKDVTIGSAQLDRATNKVRFELVMVRR